MAPCLPGDVGVGPFGLLCVPMHNGFEDLDLDRLRRRRSEKWQLHPPDVLPAFIAEMDYDLAEPLLAALREAVGLSDCGYAALDGIGETFAAFAQARHDWAVDPGMVHLVPDVMAGVDALLNLARRAPASPGSPSAPAARCCPPSWTGWRRPRG
jgi:cysteine-S-conjugate beta-lyase